MPFDATCPECGSTFKLLDKERGQRFQCEGCDHSFVAGKESRQSKDIDDPPRRDSTGLTRERSEKSAGARWNPNRKEDDDRPARKGGSRRVGKPSGDGGVNIIVIGVTAFFVVAALGVGIWVAVQERPEEAGQPGPNPINPNEFGVVNFPPPDPGFGPPPFQQPELKDLDVDSLIARVNGQAGGPFDRQPAMEELARRKEPRATQPIAQRLTDIFDRGSAEKALQTFGAAAEKEVMPFLNHPDGGTREIARRILKGYNTSQDQLVTQSLKDVNSTDMGLQAAALEWFGDQLPIPARAVEVARAQETGLSSKDHRLRDAAMKGLLRWGSKANTPAVVKMLEAHPKGGFPSEAVKRGVEALGKWKDARGASALLQYVSQPFIDNDAAKALEQIGPEAAKDVVKLMNHPNQWNRMRDLLAKYKTADEVLLGQCVEDLQAKDANQRRLAAQWLEKAKPDDRKRGEVARALVPMLKDNDHWTQDAAFKALKVWLDKEAVPGLLAILEENTPGFRFRGPRNQVIELLVLLKDERAVAPLVRRVSVREDRGGAVKALKEMGPVAEIEVLKLLYSSDNAVKVEGCHILEVIGTQKSLAALEALATGNVRDAAVRAAKSAVAAVKKRLGPG
jgi:HEAT repeat protein